VVLVTGTEHYDILTQTSREPDDEVLRQALLGRGIDVHVAVWNDPLIDWEQTARDAVVVIRSCWDYHHDREAFLTWAERIAKMTVNTAISLENEDWLHMSACHASVHFEPFFRSLPKIVYMMQ
jgi:hypothetical protein